MKTRPMILILSLCLAALVAACGSTTPSSPTSPTPAAATVTSVSVSGGAPAPGADSQFTAMATMSDGTTADVTSKATWQSLDTAIATVSSSGNVSGVAAGDVAVQATYLNVTGMTFFTVQ